MQKETLLVKSIIQNDPINDSTNLTFRANIFETSVNYAKSSIIQSENDWQKKSYSNHYRKFFLFEMRLHRLFLVAPSRNQIGMYN